MEQRIAQRAGSGVRGVAAAAIITSRLELNSNAAALVITADDYGYAAGYDDGILEAAGAGAVDAVSAMVLREGCDPEPLLRTGVEIGLHLELPGDLTGPPRAGARERQAALASLRDQLQRFEALFGRAAAYLDGHHHCHAAPGLAAAVARAAHERALPVRSVDVKQRRLLRCLGVATQDRLVGRLGEAEPALPEELRPLVEGAGDLAPGVTEWMVHPGHAEAAAGSAYDAGREEDLDLLLRLSLDPALIALRSTHLVALG